MTSQRNDKTQTLIGWVQNHNGPKRYSRKMTTMIKNALSLFGKRHVQTVTSSLLTTDFLWHVNAFIIDVIEDGESSYRTNPVTITNRRWSGSPIHVIAVLKSGFLAHCNNVSLEADIIFIDHKTPDQVEAIATWNLSYYWMRTVAIGRMASHPEFGCVLSPDELQIVIVGPPPNGYDSTGCKMIDVQYRKIIKDISVDTIGLVVAASFHRRPGYDHVLALICCRRQEQIENFARPNTTGTLLLYDHMTDNILSVYHRHSASTEILAFSHDGRFVVTRSNSERCLLILDSVHLDLLQQIPHDAGLFHTNHYSYNVLYPIFPLFSVDDSELCVLQWIDQTHASHPHHHDNQLQQQHEIQKENDNVNRTDVNQNNTVHVEFVKLPTVLRTLKEICRQVIKCAVIRDKCVDVLPLPTSLQTYVKQ